MFLDWFDLEFLRGVYDLLEDPIETIDYGPEDVETTGSNGH